MSLRKQFIKYSYLLLTLVILNSQVFSQANNRKVLFIGVDGCRWDALMAANAPSIDSLLLNAVYSGNGLTEYTTWSGTGWSNMLTGVWHTKHGVTDNSFSGSNYGSYPDFISRIELHNPLWNTVSVAHWSPINTAIIQSIDKEVNVATDLLVRDSVVHILNTTNPDILFVDFDDVDHAGHLYGFSPSTTQYVQTIELTDGYIGDILTALKNRPNYSNEDWLVVVTTDHGGIPAGHGGGTLEERTIFTVYNNPSFTMQEIVRDSVSTNITFSEAAFSLGGHASPVDQTPFLFGSSTDFTIELWVKAAGYTGDPALISNKNWNSGVNPGFVISAQQGQYWKVNLGDGSDRVDIQGGFLQPGQWHHLAVSFDRSGLMSAFEDGVLVGFDSISSIGNINSGLPLVINQDGTMTYGLNFNGSIRDIRIWNAVIPDSVIVDWATTPVSTSHPFYGSLLANWMCDDGTGSVLQDAGPNTNDCNISGVVTWLANQSNTFTVYDYSMTPREPDNAVTVLDWMCVPLQPNWNLDGKSWVAPCGITAVSSLPVMPPVSISPNPVDDLLMIQWNSELLVDANITVMDMAGRLLSNADVSMGDTMLSLNVSSLKAGIYIVYISSEYESHAWRFVKGQSK